jgi:hypothetical protein
MSILPGRPATRQRLIVGALIVAGVGLCNLISIDLWYGFGSVWPIGLLWAACGWSRLGPHPSTATLIFLLGLWTDALTGAPMGTWALAGLVTHFVTIIMYQFLGLSSLGKVATCAICAIVMMIVINVIGLWQQNALYVLGNLVPLSITVGLYGLIGQWFELYEEET